MSRGVSHCLCVPAEKKKKSALLTHLPLANQASLIFFHRLEHTHFFHTETAPARLDSSPGTYPGKTRHGRAAKHARRQQKDPGPLACLILNASFQRARPYIRVGTREEPLINTDVYSSRSASNIKAAYEKVMNADGMKRANLTVRLAFFCQGTARDNGDWYRHPSSGKRVWVTSGNLDGRTCLIHIFASCALDLLYVCVVFSVTEKKKMQYMIFAESLQYLRPLWVQA